MQRQVGTLMSSACLTNYVLLRLIFPSVILGLEITWTTGDMTVLDPRFRPQVGEFIAGIDGQDCINWTSHQYQLYLEERQVVTLRLACEPDHLC